MIKRLSALAAAAALLFAWGCVITTKNTIDAHITVDIRHIEKQADNVLDYVEGKTDAIPGGAAAGAKDKKADKPKATSMLRRAAEGLNPMGTAYAAELKQSSPAITEIATKLKARYPQLEALKAGACAGETNRGLVELRPCDAMSDPAKKNEAQQLVAAENADRKALYKEVATLNQDQKLTVNTVERVYAQKRLERAQPGQIFQLPEAGSDFDAFKKSDVGKKLGAECAPGAWVTIK